MIYFIRNKETGRIKIGKANNPQNRIKTLQTGCDGELELLAFIPGETDVELEWHREYEGFHHRGEWFNPDPSLLWEIYKMQPLQSKPESYRIWNEIINHCTNEPCWIGISLVDPHTTNTTNFMMNLPIVSRASGIPLSQIKNVFCRIPAVKDVSFQSEWVVINFDELVDYWLADF